MAAADWDGFGKPTDGGEYEQQGSGAYAWFMFLMCDRGADLSHCLSAGHVNKLRQHMSVTLGRQVHPVARPKALAAPPQPPQEPAADHETPPPAFPSTRESLEKLEKRIDELTVMMDAIFCFKT